MAPPLLTLSDMHLTFGGDPLLEGAALSVEPRARIALVGRNGSGKSTLLKIAAGAVATDKGERYLDPGVTVAYLPQEPDLSGYASVGAYVEAGLNETSDPYLSARLMDELGVDPRLTTKTLSGGEARRAAMARAFAASPDILLLDEPTNHLDLPGIQWLEETVKTMRAALVLISHDRRLLEAVTNETVWIDRGKTKQISKGFKDFEVWRDKYLEEEELAGHKLDRKIAREEHWVRYGVTARRKRNVRRMAELRALRATRKNARRATGSVNFTAASSAKSGKRVIVADGLSKAYGDMKIVDDFSIEIARGDRIGFVGPNGAGKTTLINLLTGALAPDQGSLTLGTNLEILSLDQKRASLDPDMRMADAITDGRGDWVTIGDQKKHVSSYLQEFLFSAEQWRTPVSALSGGERGRLALAAALAKPSNFMVLDEPTNDLDLETLDLLEEMLADYKGTLLLVSHDRSFLDRLATSIVAAAPDAKPGQWMEFIGGYDDMLAQQQIAPSTPSSKTQKPKPAPLATSGEKAAAKKLSYKQQFALEKLPGEIATLETKIAAMQRNLEDPSLFERDPDGFNKLAASLEACEGRLNAAEEEWLALEELKDSLSKS